MKAAAKELVGRQENLRFTEATFPQWLTHDPFDIERIYEWITRMHDPEDKKILFVMVTGDGSVIGFTFALKEIGPGASRAVFDLVYRSLNEEGARQSEGELKGKLAAMQTFLADSLRHSCETGEILKG